MRIRRPHHALLSLVLVLAFVTGCGLGRSGEERLVLGYVEWDENVAVSSLTRVLLEEELGYDVELQLSGVRSIFRGVANGELDAFQDVWMPNLKKYLEEVGGDVEVLEPWYRGRTRYGIAVPDYMKITSLTELDRAGTDMIYGIEPGAAIHPRISREIIPGYDLDMVLVESSTPAMLAQLEKAYRAKEPFVFLAWSPHWMNAEYEFHYLDDPRDLQGQFNDSSRITSIVRDDLRQDEPVAYAFMNSISLDEEQLNQLEADINRAGDRVGGVKAWLEENRDVVGPWVEAAREAGKS